MSPGGRTPAGCSPTRPGRSDVKVSVVSAASMFGAKSAKTELTAASARGSDQPSPLRQVMNRSGLPPDGALTMIMNRPLGAMAGLLLSLVAPNVSGVGVLQRPPSRRAVEG